MFVVETIAVKASICSILFFEFLHNHILQDSSCFMRIVADEAFVTVKITLLGKVCLV